MKVVNHNHIVHRAALRGMNDAVLACNPAVLIHTGSTWYGSWKETDDKIVCAKCRTIEGDTHVIVQGADNIEFAVKRLKGIQALIPVKNAATGAAMLSARPKNWGKLVFRYITEWEDVNPDV